MTTIASTSLPSVAGHRGKRLGFFAEIRSLWMQFSARAFNPYRPELYYMRGPGPAWRAKHAASELPLN